MVIIPNTFEGGMRLPEARHWRAASDKGVENLQEFGVYSLISSSQIPLGIKAGLDGCTVSEEALA